MWGNQCDRRMERRTRRSTGSCLSGPRGMMEWVDLTVVNNGVSVVDPEEREEWTDSTTTSKLSSYPPGPPSPLPGQVPPPGLRDSPQLSLD